MPSDYFYWNDDCHPCRECPKCGHDWLCEYGLIVELVDGGGWRWERQAKLSDCGRLEGCDEQLEAGFHSATKCMICRNPLVDMDNVQEVAHPEDDFV